MFKNWADHISHDAGGMTIVLVVLAIATAVLAQVYFKNYKRYRSLQFVPFMAKFFSIVVGLALIVVLYRISQPYTPPPAKTVAFVLGHTQNTPKPVLGSNLLDDYLEPTMHLHKGADARELIDAITFISAVKQPKRISLSAEGVDLQNIDLNSTNANRNVRHNIEQIQQYIDGLTPADNGANYLEAIFAAKSNADEGSNILVLGSGLSDTGELDFAHNKILTSEAARNKAVEDIVQKYGRGHLAGYTVAFYGLGDTVLPQQQLTERQKEIVRSVYQEVIQGLGGKVIIDSRTLEGPSVDTNYIVSATDTGCGELGLVFDNDAIKFVGDEATFVDPTVARETLGQVKALYDDSGDSVTSIRIDGYIAHFNTPIENLSQLRADAVKSMLSELGVPVDIMTATGKGHGPHNIPEKDRMVTINIVRDNADCTQ